MGAFAVHQSGDDIPQGGEREVDLRSFLQALPRGACFPLSLRTLGTTGALKWSGNHQGHDEKKNAYYGIRVCRIFEYFCIGLTHGQVNQMEFPHSHVLVPVHTFLAALDGDGEYGVGTRAVLVHVGGTHGTCRLGEREIHPHSILTVSLKSSCFFLSKDGDFAHGFYGPVS